MKDVTVKVTLDLDAIDAARATAKAILARILKEAK